MNSLQRSEPDWAPSFSIDPAITADVDSVSRIAAVPIFLKILRDNSALRFAAVARVTDEWWTACAVLDDGGHGIQPGDRRPAATTLCAESRARRNSLVFDRTSGDSGAGLPFVQSDPAIQSYITAPIIRANGEYFGSLCAFDSDRRQDRDPKLLSLFDHFASIIAAELDGQVHSDAEHAALLDERALSELRDQFVAILGHDLRNPLQSIHATADLLERRLAGHAEVDLARRIRSSAERMSGLIADVLDFARIRLGGGIDIDRRPVDDVDGQLAAVVQELQDVHLDREIVCDLTVNRAVQCDIGRMQQVLSNLTANALTHASDNAPVHIRGRVDDREWILEVHNAGDPIPPENLAKIFQPYWRSSGMKSRQGLGLGLHISAQIVRAHEGVVSVKSGRDEGTTFTVRLPLTVNT